VLADLVSREFFTARAEWLLWLMTFASIAALVVGADRLVGAAARLAAALGISKVIIGATVVSLGTTSPEAAVSVRAAWAGDPGLALGNGMGSIICDTALIFGLCCCITRLPLDRFVLNRQGWFQQGSGALLAGIIVGLWILSGGDLGRVVLGRGVGVALLILLIGYMLLSVRWSRAHPEALVRGVARNRSGRVTAGGVVVNLMILVIGLTLVVGGAEVLIGSVREICLRRHVPEAVLAGTLVAFGTSLPELVTAIASVLKGHGGLLIGNVVGADVLNVLFVIGASAAAQPLQVGRASLYLFVPVMMVVLVLFRVFILMNRDHFRRWQGVPLLVVYATFIFLAVKYFRFGY